MTVDQEWRLSAACRGRDPHLWFPSPPKGNDHDIYRTGRAICHGCPVREKCLRAALDEEARTLGSCQRRWGMRGGLTPAERDQLGRGQVAS